MRPRKPAVPPPPLAALPVAFQAGEHALSILRVADGRWTVAVDGLAVAGSFRNLVEAWEAGVRAAGAKGPTG
jgi:hypothetical protein